MREFRMWKYTRGTIGQSALIHMQGSIQKDQPLHHCVTKYWPRILKRISNVIHSQITITCQLNIGKNNLSSVLAALCEIL